jgi:hypothetical protein
LVGRNDSRGEIDTHLDDFTPRHAEIMPLEIGARDSRGLRLGHVQRQTTPGDQRRDCKKLVSGSVGRRERQVPANDIGSESTRSRPLAVVQLVL